MQADSLSNHRSHQDFGLTQSIGRDFRVDILRGVALLMIFLDHSSGNIFSYGTLQTLQFSDAAEFFFLLSGYSCMAAYGRKLDNGNIKGAAFGIGRQLLRLYAAQLLSLLAALALVWAWGFTRPLQFDSLHRLSGVLDSRIGLASSELFQANGWREALDMISLMGEPAFFDILRTYIILIAIFPVMWLGLRRAPFWTFAVSALVWVSAHGDFGMHFNDALQGAPWVFNPFGWQFIFLCGAGLRIIMQSRRTLPKSRILLVLSLCVVGAGLLFHLCFAFGIVLPHPLLGRVNLSPVRVVNTGALIYLAMSYEWHPRVLALPVIRVLRVCGRHSLLIFSLGILMSLNVDLAFISFGQGLVVQILATFAGVVLLMAAAYLAETRRRRIQPAFAMA